MNHRVNKRRFTLIISILLAFPFFADSFLSYVCVEKMNDKPVVFEAKVK